MRITKHDLGRFVFPGVTSRRRSNFLADESGRNVLSVRFRYDQPRRQPATSPEEVEPPASAPLQLQPIQQWQEQRLSQCRQAMLSVGPPRTDLSSRTHFKRGCHHTAPVPSTRLRTSYKKRLVTRGHRSLHALPHIRSYFTAVQRLCPVHALRLDGTLQSHRAVRLTATSPMRSCPHCIWWSAHVVRRAEHQCPCMQVVLHGARIHSLCCCRHSIHRNTWLRKAALHIPILHKRRRHRRPRRENR